MALQKATLFSKIHKHGYFVYKEFPAGTKIKVNRFTTSKGTFAETIIPGTFWQVVTKES